MPFLIADDQHKPQRYRLATLGFILTKKAEFLINPASCYPAYFFLIKQRRSSLNAASSFNTSIAEVSSVVNLSSIVPGSPVKW